MNGGGGFQDKNKNKCDDIKCQQLWERVVSTHKILRQAIRDNMKGSNLPVWVITTYGPTADASRDLFDSNKLKHKHVDFDESTVVDFKDEFR